MRFGTRAGAILAVVLPLAAGAAEMHADHGTMAGGSEAAQALKAANDRMMSAMELKPSGNPDRDFVSMMIPHHEGAIEMAKVELQYGKDPAIRKLAEAVIAAQEKEIAEMKGWLAANP